MTVEICLAHISGEIRFVAETATGTVVNLGNGRLSALGVELSDNEPAYANALPASH